MYVLVCAFQSGGQYIYSHAHHLVNWDFTLAELAIGPILHFNNTLLSKIITSL